MYKAISGTYNLAADVNTKTLPIEIINLSCDTSAAPVIVNLPKIADLTKFLNIKIVINDVSNNAGANNITINTNVADTINTAASLVINTNGGSAYIIISNLTSWMGSLSTSSGALLGLPANAVFVDAVFGNDLTGVAYRLDKPFATIKAAEAAAGNGDTVYVWPGEYAGANNNGMGLNTLNYYFCDGAVVIDTTATGVFSDAAMANGESFSVSGYGNFQANSVGGNIVRQLNGTSVVFEAKSISVSSESSVFSTIDASIIEATIYGDVQSTASVNMFTCEDVADGLVRQIVTINGSVIKDSAQNITMFTMDATNPQAHQTITANRIFLNSVGSIATVGGGVQQITCGDMKCTTGTSAFICTAADTGFGKQILNGNIVMNSTGGVFSFVSNTLELECNLNVTGGGIFTINTDDGKVNITGRWEVDNGDIGIGTVAAIGGAAVIRLFNAVLKNKNAGASASGITFADNGGSVFIIQSAIITSNAGGAFTLIGPAGLRDIAGLILSTSNADNNINYISPNQVYVTVAAYMDNY